MSATEPAPRAFRVLDVVEVARHGAFIASGLAGRRGVVLSVRRYANGEHRYSVGSLPGDPGYDEVPGIYGENDLRPTGERANPELYGPVPPFLLRDIVRISPDCDIAPARECTGYIRAAFDHRPGESPTVGVWVYDIEEDCEIDVRFLTRTGERLPAPPRGRSATSTHVSVDGEVSGHSSYAIVDDIEQYL